MQPGSEDDEIEQPQSPPRGSNSPSSAIRSPRSPPLPTITRTSRPPSEAAQLPAATPLFDPTPRQLTNASAPSPIEASKTSPPSTQAVSVYDIPAKSLRDQIQERLKLDFDAYDDDEAEQRFLHSKPACFLIVGKPGVGKTTLAKKLAEDWLCEYINPTDLLKQSIANKTELGLLAEEILLKGELLDSSLVLKMLEEKMKTGVSHQGYVLDGFPTLLDDPDGATSARAMDVGAQVDLLKSFPLQPDFIVHIRLSDEDLEERRKNQKIDSQTGDIYIKEMYTPTPLPPPPEPAPIVDPAAAKLLGADGLVGPAKKPTDDDEDEDEPPEEEDEEEEDEEAKKPKCEYDELPDDVKQRLVTREEDQPENVTKSLTQYRNHVQKTVLDYVKSHDPVKVIELDGNVKADELAKQLIAWLDTFGAMRACPVRMFHPREPGDTGAEEEAAAADVDTEELFRSLCNTNPVSPRWRWRRSRWARYCPVALYDGDLVEGKAPYAVSFLDKMYVLSSEEALKRFMANPRPYLMSPMPRPTCKIIVTGPKQSGRTTLARRLAFRFGGKLIDMEEVMKPITEEAQREQLEQLRRETTEQTIKAIKARQNALRAEIAAHQEEERRREEARQRKKQILSEAGELPEAGGEDGEGAEGAPEDKENADGEPDAPKEGAEDGTPQKAEDEDAPEKDAPKDEEPSKETAPAEEGAAAAAPKEEAGDAPAAEGDGEGEGEGAEGADQTSSDGPTTTSSGESAELEHERRASFLEDVIDENYPEVIAAVEAALAHAREQLFKLPVGQWLDVLEQEIQKAEAERRERLAGPEIHGGWVLDNFPRSPDEWTAYLERAALKKFMPDDLIVLRDQSDTQDAMIKRWYKLNRAEIDAAIFERSEKVRLELEEREAAQKAKEEEEARKRAEEEAERLRAHEAALAEAREAELAEKETLKQLGVKEKTFVDPEKSAVAEEGGAGGEKEGAAEDEEGAGEKAEADADAEAEGTEGAAGVPPVAVADEVEEVEMKPEPPRELPPEGPEFDALKNRLKEFDLDWAIVATTVASIGILPTEIGVEALDADQLFVVTCRTIEKKFQYQAAELSGEDLNDEEEDAAAEKAAEADEYAALRGDDEEKGNEEEETEEKDPNRSKRKHLGDTNWFCPVTFKERGIMFPSNPEIGAKYRERIYYLVNYEAREKFVARPMDYLRPGPSLVAIPPPPDDEAATGSVGGEGAAAAPPPPAQTQPPAPGKGDDIPRQETPVETMAPPQPPALRLLIIGPKGSGKSTLGKFLADQLGLYHVSFREKLHELIMPKAKRPVGPEHKEAFAFEKEYAEMGDQEKQRVAAEEEAEQAAKEAAEAEAAAIEGKPAPAAPAAPAPAATPEGGEKKEGDEEKEEEMTDNERAIQDYLENDIGLPNEVLDLVLPQLWQKEPYLSAGFVLEGFPTTLDEVRYLIDTHGQGTSPKGGGFFVPDACLLLNLETIDVAGRLLMGRFDLWKARRDRKRAFREEVKKKIREKREEKKKKRREDLLKEKEAIRVERQAQKLADKMAMGDEEMGEEEEDEEDEDSMNAEIEEALNTEFEDIEEDEGEEESEEDAMDRLRNELNDQYDNDVNKQAIVQQALEECMVPVLTVNAGRKMPIVRSQLMRRLKPLIECRASVFERVYAVSPGAIDKMLRAGYVRHSRFGRWDVVELATAQDSVGNTRLPVQPLPKAPAKALFPAVYRSYAYFFASEANRTLFAGDVLKYLKLATPKPNVPIRLSIVGPPKSGKTWRTLFGTLRASIGEAIRYVLRLQSRTTLAKRMNEFLLRGFTVPDELAIEALDRFLANSLCRTRGYVLDAYPVTKKQLSLLIERNIVPTRTIELYVDSAETLKRGKEDRLATIRSVPLHDSAQILAVRHEAYVSAVNEPYEEHEGRGGLRVWTEQHAKTYVHVDATLGKWALANRLMGDLREAILGVQEYVHRAGDHRAAPLANLGITPREFRARLGEYGYYCPVRLQLHAEMVDNEERAQSDLRTAAEFRGRYYVCAGEEELKMFLENPERFTPPQATRSLPTETHLLPRRVLANFALEFPQQVEFHGYCPVTFLDGRSKYEAIIPGKKNLLVQYNNKFYCFDNEEKLNKFLRLPEKYSAIKLPSKLPPPREPAGITGLPLLGFLEQTLADTLIVSLSALGNLKPKFPHMSASRAAIVYLALYLKAHNPKSPDYVREKYEKKQKEFEENCRLPRLLGRSMTVNYKPPRELLLQRIQAFERCSSINDSADYWVQ